MLQSCSSKIDYIIKFSFSNVTHASRNMYQVTLTFMENQGNPQNYNENIESLW